MLLRIGPLWLGVSDVSMASVRPALTARDMFMDALEKLFARGLGQNWGKTCVPIPQ